jgi:RNA polymerase sigma factor (sigma-70 family)
VWVLRSSDQRLVAAVRAGDERAFEQLHARYEGVVFGFCRHLTGQREDAEDAVQHTFLAAYRLMTESDRRLEVRPWLFTVARNRCLTLLARRRPVQPAADAAEPTVADLTEEVQRREDLRQLVRDLGGLPEPQRAALLLSELEALSHREVAQVLDVPAARVKALVFQARSSLAATREAREAPCRDVREQLATLSGSALRRRLLRRHVHECSGCSEFAAAISRQRRGLAALLPAAAVRGGWRTLVGRGAEGAVGGTGGVGAGSTAAGGGALGGSLAGLGAPAIVKVVAVVAAVSGGTVGVASGTVPAGVGDVVGSIVGDRSEQAPSAFARAAPGAGEAPQPQVAPGGSTTPAGTRLVDRPRPSGREPARERGPHALPAGADAHAPGRPGISPGQSGKTGSTPPGLAKHGGSPPGQEKGEGGRPDVPPGKAKKGGQGGRPEAPPGQTKKGEGGQGGRPDAPPGQAKTGESGRPDVAPGQAKQGQGGQSGAAPGQTKQSPASAPGQAKQGESAPAPRTDGQGGAPASPPGQAKPPSTSGQPAHGGQGGRGVGGLPQE